MRSNAVTPRLLAVLCLAAAALSSCGDTDSASSSACSEPEQILEAGGVHVLPGVDITYDHSPPTSGPHQLPPPEAGISRAPIREPLQVSALEAGLVLVQYQPDLPADGQASLEELSGTEGVLVAPAATPIDDDAQVALTAWGVRQLCASVDVDAAQAFIDQWVGVVFVNHDS